MCIVSIINLSFIIYTRMLSRKRTRQMTEETPKRCKVAKTPSTGPLWFTPQQANAMVTPQTQPFMYTPQANEHGTGGATPLDKVRQKLVFTN